MMERKPIFDSLMLKMQEAGFQFEKTQKPHRQKRKENELVFIHPNLVKKFEQEGYKVNAHKFYIKPLTDEPDSEIGLVTGKTSPLHKLKEFNKPNTTDTHDDTPAWTNRESDFALDKLLKDIKGYLSRPSDIVDKNKNAFLFLWNPNLWDWMDIEETIDHLRNVGSVLRRWSCGNSKKIKKGDRVFLVRVGKEPRGIMGSGYAKSSYYVAPHWDGTKGKTSNYIDIEFDVLINPEKHALFDKESLEMLDPNNLQQWFPQQSGISIKSEIIESLETNWFNFITSRKHIGNGFISNDVTNDLSESYVEGKSKEITQTQYERNPQARKICLKIHGYSCQICNFNFEHAFGEIGRGFIHVHHIRSISDLGGKEYGVDPKNDLIPVCPNCHAMIHSKRPAFTIEEMKSIRKNNKDGND